MVTVVFVLLQPLPVQYVLLVVSLMVIVTAFVVDGTVEPFEVVMEPLTAPAKEEMVPRAPAPGALIVVDPAVGVYFMVPEQPVLPEPYMKYTVLDPWTMLAVVQLPVKATDPALPRLAVGIEKPTTPAEPAYPAPAAAGAEPPDPAVVGIAVPLLPVPP